ncbi:MAG TPA: hypothetical protein VFO37_02220 [Chitinophagaceae bacterium]|nr:hypothetical protein [Chitinophagaceae bacterium]
MNRNKITGLVLIITGCVLSIIGITLLFIKSSSMIPFISVPVMFFGILIWHNAERNSSVTADEAGEL